MSGEIFRSWFVQASRDNLNLLLARPRPTNPLQYLSERNPCHDISMENLSNSTKTGIGLEPVQGIERRLSPHACRRPSQPEQLATLCSKELAAGIPALALRPREAAKVLSISERTLWTLTNRREIPHLRLGRAILYPVDGLRSWLAGQSGTEGCK